MKCIKLWENNIKFKQKFSKNLKKIFVKFKKILRKFRKIF